MEEAAFRQSSFAGYIVYGRRGVTFCADDVERSVQYLSLRLVLWLDDSFGLFSTSHDLGIFPKYTLQLNQLNGTVPTSRYYVKGLQRIACRPPKKFRQPLEKDGNTSNEIAYLFELRREL